MEGKGTAVEFVALIIGRKQWGSKKKKKALTSTPEGTFML